MVPAHEPLESITEASRLGRPFQTGLWRKFLRDSATPLWRDILKSYPQLHGTGCLPHPPAKNQRFLPAPLKEGAVRRFAQGCSGIFSAQERTDVFVRPLECSRLSGDNRLRMFGKLLWCGDYGGQCPQTIPPATGRSVYSRSVPSAPTAGTGDDRFPAGSARRQFRLHPKFRCTDGRMRTHDGAGTGVFTSLTRPIREMFRYRATFQPRLTDRRGAQSLFASFLLKKEESTRSHYSN